MSVNGAGKSTLAAVLLGLYDPTSGSVEVGDGGSSGAIAVFQDFARHSLTVRDNVGFGDLARLRDDVALRRGLAHAGSNFDGDLDAWLGAEFGGHDLSGGQWLRVAIARGVLPDSGLIVLDGADGGPRSAGRGGPRPAPAGGRPQPDRDHRLPPPGRREGRPPHPGHSGVVVEEGTHADLLARGGLYARMWRAQASWYVPAAAE